jgi:hypothetical protein
MNKDSQSSNELTTDLLTQLQNKISWSVDITGKGDKAMMTITARWFDRGPQKYMFTFFMKDRHDLSLSSEDYIKHQQLYMAGMIKLKIEVMYVASQGGDWLEYIKSKNDKPLPRLPDVL